MKTKTIKGRQLVEFPVALAHATNYPWVHVPWGAYTALKTSLEKPASTRAAIEASGRHTPQGIKAECRRAALRDVVPAVRRAREALSLARSEQEKIRARMVAKPVDESPVGFLMRQELRAHLKSLDAAAQAALLSKAGDSRYAAAAAEMPRELSGISESLHARAVASAVEAGFPEEVKQLAQLDEVIAAVESAVRLIGLETRADTSLDPSTLERLAEIAPELLVDAASDPDRAEELLRRYVDPTREDRISRISERTGLPRSGDETDGDEPAAA